MNKIVSKCRVIPMTHRVILRAEEAYRTGIVLYVIDRIFAIFVHRAISQDWNCPNVETLCVVRHTIRVSHNL
jgi:hypothetical protein